MNRSLDLTIHRTIEYNDQFYYQLIDSLIREMIRRFAPPAACRRLIRHGVRLPSILVRPSRIALTIPSTVRSSVLIAVTACPTISLMCASLPAVIGML
jgi:hypothetical protein